MLAEIPEDEVFARSPGQVLPWFELHAGVRTGRYHHIKHATPRRVEEGI